jgi:hypothetical protein
MAEQRTDYSAGNEPVDPTETCRWRAWYKGGWLYFPSLAYLLLYLAEELEAQAVGAQTYQVERLERRRK